MDFIVAENIEIADFNVGDNVTFTFEVRDELVITEISLEANEKTATNMRQIMNRKLLSIIRTIK